MNIRVRSITFESIFFYSCLGVSLLVIILNPVNPTLDGPSHLYNAKLMNYLLSGNEFIGYYYTLTKVPVANLTDHYLLAFSMNFFSWQLSEKLLIIAYLFSFSLLFRKLLKQWNSANPGFSIFAIPFSFSSFYYMGFYNFCLSFPLLFGMLIYYYKYFMHEESKPTVGKYLKLGVMATVLYFTNGLVFLFAGLSLFLLEINIPNCLLADKLSERKPVDLKRLLLLYLVWIPGIICFVVFIFKVHMNPTNKRVAFYDLINWINIIKPIIISGKDEIYTRYIFYLLGIILVTGLYNRIKKAGITKFYPADFFLVLSIISFLAYILIPNDASVGMMSLRLLYIFFVFIVLWIAMLPNNKVIIWIGSIALIAMHFIMLFENHQPIISNLNKDVELVRNSGEVIKPNSVILAKDYTNNWQLFHFADYLGMDKPLIILENYEADDLWFAITWNNYVVPQILLDGNSPNRGYFNMSYIPSHETKNIDYIFVYGNYKDTVQRPDAKAMSGILGKAYKLIYTSADSNIHIFSLPKIATSR